MLAINIYAHKKINYELINLQRLKQETGVKPCVKKNKTPVKFAAKTAGINLATNFAVKIAVKFCVIFYSIAIIFAVIFVAKIAGNIAAPKN